MSAFDTVVKFFQDSGLFIYPSLLIMAVGLAIAIERFVFLQRARSQNSRLWSQLHPLLQGGRLREARDLSAKSDAAVGRIVANGLERLQSPGRREDIDAAMEEGMMQIVPRLEKRTHYIATFANVITLVGLLGTIIGLIKGFTAVAAVNPAEKAEMLSASISIAMNNTAFALMVAIPFMLIHAFLQARTGEIVDGLEAAKISFLNSVQRVRGENMTGHTGNAGHTGHTGHTGPSGQFVQTPHESHAGQAAAAPQAASPAQPSQPARPAHPTHALRGA